MVSLPSGGLYSRRGNRRTSNTREVYCDGQVQGALLWEHIPGPPDPIQGRVRRGSPDVLFKPSSKMSKAKMRKPRGEREHSTLEEQKEVCNA